MNFEEYFQRIEQAEQSVNELNQPSGEGIASSMPDYMPGIEAAAEEYSPGWMSSALNAVRPEWEERRNRWEELGAAALYGDFLKAGKQGELDARVREVMDKNKVFRDFMEAGDKPLSRMYMGREVMRALYGSRFRDVPEMYFHSRGEQMPENGRQSLNDGYAAVWDDFSDKTRKKYADYQQKKAEFQRGLEEFGRELETALPEAVLQGKTLSPDMMEKATRYGQAEKVTASLQRARAAVDLIRGVNRGGASYGAHEGAVHAETEKILQEENKAGSYYRFLGMEFGKPKTEEEAEQQARANLGNSYEVTREFISHLANVLSDEDGQLDEGALGAMMLALDADAQGQQTIDSRFVRNTLEGLRRWGSESADFLNRYGMRAFDSVGLLAPTWQDDLQRYNAPRIEVLKDNLAKLEDSRLTASDKATFLAGMMTDLGTVTGESSPAILGGFINPAAAAIAFIPSAVNRSIASNHAEGNPNAEFTGLIEGTFEGVAESFFGVATKSVPIIGKALDKAALGLMSRPALGKIASKVQGNVYLRYLSDRVVAESLGELVGEEVISQTGSYLTIQAMRQMDVDMKDKQWAPFSTAWETIQDERQSTATVVYCAALGLMGLKADMNAAAAFSRSRKNLETVGLKPETASRLALMAEQAINKKALLQQAGDANAAEIQRTEDELQKELQKAYLEEVVNEDPVKLRDRLKKNHELFMSDIDAQVALREGVLKAALREQGALDVKESLTGKNIVTVTDREQLEKDREGWEDGEMPADYETPTKQVEWTDEQLAAYSQYAIGNEGLKRMKAIRSSALNLDMAAKVNEKDYAKTLPLTESSVPVAAELARSKGAMTIDVLRALSEAAAREGENGRSVLPGVSNAAVGSMEGSFMKRLQWEARSGDTAGASRMLAGEGGAAAIRLTAGEGPASRIVYNPGHTLSTNLAEDVVESMLVDKLQKEGGMDGRGHLTDAGKDWLSAMHREMREVRRQVLAATGRDIMPGLEKAEPSLMNVTEYFSHLAQSAFYRQAGEYGLNDAAMRHVKFMDSALIQAKFLNDMGAGFAKWAATEAGRAWQKEGGTLAGLLQETGHELADLYTNSRVTAENVAAVEEARMYRRANGTRTVEDIRAELEEAEQEGTEAEGGSVREAYPKSARWRAFVKARYQLRHAEDIYNIEKDLFKVGVTDEVARYDARGNVYKPKWAPAGSKDYQKLLDRLRKEVAEGDKKRGRLTMAPSEELAYYEETAALAEEFKDELEVWRKKNAAREKAEWERIMGEDSREIPAEESITGESIPAEANEEVPDADPESGQFVPPPGSVIETDPEGKGRGLEGGRYAEDGVEGSVIGMVPFSSLVFSEWPFSRFAAADGMAEALRHADGRMEVIMGGALLRQDERARSVKVRVWDADAAHNEAWARGRVLEQIALAGLAPKVFSVRDYLEYYRHLYPAGLPGKETLGKLGKKAFQAVAILEKAAPEVVRDVLSGAVSAADAYAAVETASTQEGQRFYLDQKAADRKASLEYLTALTRAREAAPGTDADMLRRQARYVVAARKEIRKAVARLQDVRGEKPRVVAQRELGIDLPTAEAVADAMKRLGLLDASFDAFEADLDVPGRAAEWDGKSPTGVVGSFFQAREEVKEMKAGTEASEAAGRMARKRGRREEQQAQPADEQKPAPDKLEDAGREIRAHKDRYSDRITEPLKAEMPEDFSKVTASRYFPEPDWEKLVNDGVSQDVIVAVALIRNLLPDKPRGRKASYLGKEWLNAMKMYRRSTAELLEGSLKPEEFFAMLAKQGEKWERQVDLFRGLGYPYCLKAMGMQLSTWTSYPDRKVKWRVERHMKSRVVISGDGDVRMYDTREEAIEAFRVAAAVQSALENETKQKEGEDGKSEKKRKDVKLTIRYYNSGPKKGEYFICRDLPGSARIKLKDGLASGKEAREYMYAHMDELQEKLRRIARKPDVMLEVSSERVGEDYRNGKNVDNAMLMETFGINGITYGNWVSGPERQAKLNATYDAFLDLAHLLGIPPRAISLNGSLGFQFGASGVGRYSAHYRPADVSINLTRKKGDGSLAHEWWHALDHYFMRAHAGMNMELASNHTQSRIAPNSARRTEDGGFQYDYQYSTPGMNEDAGRAFAELVHAIQRSRYAERSTAMGRQYWGSNIEMTARAFQTYIVKKARDAGVLNEYLSAYQSKEVFSEIDREFFESTGIDRYPYPTDEEMEKLAPLFDRFFAALTHVRQENGNYVTFSVTDAEDMGAPAETTFSVAALNGDGTVLRPEAFITRPDGNPDWFTIPKRKGQAAMPVRLLVGEDTAFHKGYGLTHIAASRDLDGLWSRVTPERYLSSILSNVSELWEISPGRELLVKGKRPSAWMVLQLARKEEYYSIVTAHPVAGSRKPNGKRLPLAERIAGKNQTRVDRSQRPANPDAVPGAFPGGQESEAATLASTAGGGYATSLPLGTRVVNINDVRLRFDDGRQMNAGGSVSTMSLALMDDGLDTAPHLKEHVVQQLIGDVRTAVRRFNRVFAGNTGVEAAAREMGQAQALLGMINKYAARGYRPRLTAQMRYVEVYARMLESGKILSYGKLNAQELESLKEDLEAELSDAVDVSARGIAWEAAEGGLSGKHELERLEIQARQEVRDLLVRDYAGRKLDEVVRDMLNQGAAQLEKQLKDEEMARIGKLLDFIRPRRDPKTGKLKKGLMNADAYRRVARITRMMEAPAEKKAEEMERLNVQLAGDGLAEADHDRIALELLDWSAYGALESMSLDAVRAAGESLRELVLTERNVWESKLEDEKRRLKKVAQDAAAVLGRADATKMRQMTEKEERTFRKFGVIGRHLMSFSQAMYAMSGMPGVMKDLARETLDAVADGHVALTAREKAVMDELEGFMKEELGLKEKRQRADFIQGLKKTIKTGIVREKVRVHSLDLTVEEAQRWISMSREERQAERDRMREEAEIKGWAVEAMVEEDDVLPLKEAVHSALNPPPRIDGKKGRKRERVQVRREFMEKQEPLEASADQLLNVILTYEQPFYEENARMNGYTPEVLDALRRKVGADALAFGYKMRELLSDSGVAEEFERREGVPFPAQANYWMSRFHDPSRINQDRDALDMETGTGTRYGMLVQRVDHRHEVDLSLGASNVFLAACTQQNNYLIMGRMTARWRRLLANKEFAGALKQRLGDGLFSSLRQMVDLFDGAGVMEAVTQRAMGSLLGMIQNAHAVSVLSAALTTIAKQPSALMHAAAFKSPARVMKQLLLDRAGAGRISFAEMLRKPFFQARFKDDRVFVELMHMGANAKWTRMAGMARVGMQALEHVDVWSNCASMTALYNLTWKDLEKENRAAAVPMTEEQMEEVCDRTVKNALELVGQPQRLTQRSMMAALGKSSLWERMSCYMGSEALNKVGMSAAIGEKARAEGDGVVKRFGRKMLWLSTMSGVEQVILMLLDLMRGNGPDDDEVPEWLVYNALTGLSGLGLLNTLPILGPTLEEASGQLNKLITGNGKGFIKTGLLDDMLFNLRGWIRCVRRFGDADKMSGEEMAMAIHNLVRLGAAGTGLGRGVNSTMQWTSTLSGTLQSFSAVGNMLRPLLQRAINEEKQEKKERRERARKW
ncbi:MAG: LPD5 domain-containing protein [Akkermansia muciniphila]